MSLTIRISKGEVVMWEYRARPAPIAPAPRREPIRLDLPPLAREASGFATFVALALFCGMLAAWVAIVGGA